MRGNTGCKPINGREHKIKKKKSLAHTTSCFFWVFDLYFFLENFRVFVIVCTCIILKQLEFGSS